MREFDPKDAERNGEIPDSEPVVFEHTLLLIGGPMSGRTMKKVGKLERWEIIHHHNTNKLVAYEQDRPASERYFFHKAKTAWLEEHQESILARVGHKMSVVEWVEGKQ